MIENKQLKDWIISDIYFESDGSKISYFWSDYRVEHDNQISLPRLTELNSEAFREQLLEVNANFLSNITDFIDETAQQPEIYRQLVYASTIAEQGHNKGSFFLNLVKALVLESEIKKRKCSSIRYIGRDEDVTRVLRALCKQYEIKFSADSQEKKPFFHIRAIVFFFHLVLRCAISRTLAKKKLENLNSNTAVFSYLFNLKIVDKSSITFNQLGNLPSIIENKNLKTHYYHLFPKSKEIKSFNDARQVLKTLNSNINQTHQLLEQSITWKDIVRILITWLKLSIRKLNLTIGINWKYSYLFHHLQESVYGPQAIQSLFHIYFFQNILSKDRFNTQGFYLQENQGWERILLYQWKKNQTSPIYGIAHASIRFWDTRYYDHKLISILPAFPSPDLCLVNGPLAESMMVNSGYNRSNLRKIEALRYMNLKASTDGHCNKKNQISIIGDIDYEDTIEILTILKNIMNTYELDFNILIRPHPSNDILKTSEYDIDYSSSIQEIVKESQITVFSSNTTSILEALYVGGNLVTYVSGRKLNMSPLKGFMNIPEVHNAKMLYEFIQHPIFSSGTVEDYFTLNDDYHLINKLLEENI